MKLRDQAYQRFTRGLLKREIRSGQFVSQRELALITGMTLGAIRELIPRLRHGSHRCPQRPHGRPKGAVRPRGGQRTQ